MKFTSTFVAAASLFGVAVSQNTTNGTDYATGLVAALNGANLTILATLLQGQPALAGALQTGNYSVFAPTNAALTAFVGNQSLSSINASVITQILQYHVTPVAVRQSALSANRTIVPSLLQAPLLGANMTHPLVAYVSTTTGPSIALASGNVPIGANVTYRNLLVHTVSSVLTPPQNLTTSLALANLTTLTSALSGLGAAAVAGLSVTPRITVFAPSNAAFANLSSVIATLNTTQVGNVLLNHVINGTVVYSNAIMASTTALSARGQTFRFMMMNGSTFVMSGNTTAVRISRPDIPITNGVLHIIDGVLANTA